MPAEKCAYALARYSRSPDSIRASLDWVRSHDSRKFLESYYFQYGHASIADLGHVVLCFEGISELAAIEIEDEQLWDGQARSSRYQDFSKSGYITPDGLDETQSALYAAAATKLLAAYQRIHSLMVEYYRERFPRPESMKPDAYQRNIAARAFDVARYLLFLGIPTGVGQVTSIRTLERQIRRLKASEYAEVREIAAEAASACAEPPDCLWDSSQVPEPLAPTLAKYVDVDEQIVRVRENLRRWAEQNLPPASGMKVDSVDLLKPADTPADVVATLLYPVTDRPFRELYELARGWSPAMRAEVIDLAAGSRSQREELVRGFRTGVYAFDFITDVGAYRDLHRHRRCQQFRQNFTAKLGYDIPRPLEEAGVASEYRSQMDSALEAASRLPEPSSHYLLPFGLRCRSLFRMDFAEVEYISRLRSGVKGHFSYREVAWRMKQKIEELEPELGRFIIATPPDVVDPLCR